MSNHEFCYTRHCIYKVVVLKYLCCEILDWIEVARDGTWQIVFKKAILRALW